MEPIFNESFIEKEICRLREQCTGPIGKAKKVSACSKKKRKRQTPKPKIRNAIQTGM